MVFLIPHTYLYYLQASCDHFLPNPIAVAIYVSNMGLVVVTAVNIKTAILSDVMALFGYHSFEETSV